MIEGSDAVGILMPSPTIGISPEVGVFDDGVSLGELESRRRA